MNYNTNDLDNEKVKFTLEQATKVQRWSIGNAYSFFNLGARWDWVVNATPQPLYPRGRDPARIVQEDSWAPRSVWTGAGNLAPTGVRSPDRPSRSKSLYRCCKLLTPPMKMEQGVPKSRHIKFRKRGLTPKKRILLSHLCGPCIVIYLFNKDQEEFHSDRASS
jgi:hypothetical protein